MSRKMGLEFGLEDRTRCYKRKFRWLFRIPEVSAVQINTLPPSKGSRPNLTFKEIEVQHASETVYIPGKPDWKPLTLTLYDVARGENPVFKWIKKLYDPQSGDAIYKTMTQEGFAKRAELEMYSGAGDIIETWVFETVWPQAADFEDLDMGASDLCMVTLTLRYARAYIVQSI